jgi:hypothetical protein
VKNVETGVIHSSHATKANATKQVKLLNAIDHGFKGGAKATGRMRVGMGLTKKETQDFITASYAKKKNVNEVNGYKLDRTLSTKKNKVYVNPEGKVIIANAGTSDMLDWVNNAYVPMGLYHTTTRFKEAEKIQKDAINKYGKENITNVAHSQAGEILRNLADRGLTNEAVAVNPFILGNKHEGVDVIRSSGDIVSLMTPDVKETIPSKSWNPITEHSQNILARGGSFGAVLGQIFTGKRRKNFGGKGSSKKGGDVLSRNLSPILSPIRPILSPLNWFVGGKKGGWSALSNLGHKMTPALNFMRPAYLDDMGGIPQAIGRIGGKKSKKFVNM